MAPSKYYLRVAKKIDVEPGEDGAALFAMMDNLAHEIVRDPDTVLNHRIIRLTARQARALADYLDTVVNDLEPAGEREQRYGVVVACYRHGSVGSSPRS